jgi:hypothetical protein
LEKGHEFKDLDYPNKEKMIVKLKYAKGNFILWPHKDIILNTCSSPILSPLNRENEGTPTSETPLVFEDPHSHHSLQQQDILLNTA